MAVATRCFHWRTRCVFLGIGPVPTLSHSYSDRIFRSIVTGERASRGISPGMLLDCPTSRAHAVWDSHGASWRGRRWSLLSLDCQQDNNRFFQRPIISSWHGDLSATPNTARPLDRPLPLNDVALVVSAQDCSSRSSRSTDHRIVDDGASPKVCDLELGLHRGIATPKIRV